MRQFFAFITAFMLGGCGIAQNMQRSYHLVTDDPALQRVTLEIEGTRISGQGPCNRYFGSITHSDAVPNNITLGPVASTRMACPNLSAEYNYFQNLQRVSGVEVMHDGVFLTTIDKAKMVFKNR